MLGSCNFLIELKLRRLQEAQWFNHALDVQEFAEVGEG